VKGTAAWDATSTSSLVYADVFVRCPRFCHWLDRRATRCASRCPAHGKREREGEREGEDAPKRVGGQHHPEGQDAPKRVSEQHHPVHRVTHGRLHGGACLVASGALVGVCAGRFT
jgi:hypothetical protein